MVFEGKVFSTFEVNNEKIKLNVKANIVPNEEFKKKYNLYIGNVKVNNRKYNLDDVEYYVNAQYLAEKVYDIEYKKLRAKYKNKLKRVK